MSKQQLPPGAAEALGFAMADANQQFQSTDVVNGLPRYRFITALQDACELEVFFEMNAGRVLVKTHEKLEFRPAGPGGRWVVTPLPHTP